MQQQARWLAAGRYEVGEVVGRGGYGMVCRGVDRKTGQPVALKMLSPEAGRDPDVVERMLREQQALVALSGTCAVTAIDLCRLESGAPCLVMEWLDGHDLEQQLSAWEAAGERGSTAQLLEVMKPIARTLERAHELGIVHRDIKPANIFLVAEQPVNVKLLDFGLSRMKSAAPLTAIGMVMGSPSYIAPETWRGNSAALDGRADLFALGVIVFRWLTGSLPFAAPDLIGKMTAVTSGPRPRVTALRAELPAAIDDWASRALAVEPAERFQSGSEFYDALAAALGAQAWAVASDDVSGVRSTSMDPAIAAEERKGAFATALSAAATLLKRFTGPRERATPEVVPLTEAATSSLSMPDGLEGPRSEQTEQAEQAEQADTSDRQSIWLDASDLEEIENAADILPAEPETAAPFVEPRSERVPQTTPKQRARPKTKAKSSSNAKTKRKAKAKAKRASKAKKATKRRRAAR